MPMEKMLTAKDLSMDNIVAISDGISMAQSLCYGQSHAGGWWTDLETGEPKQRNVGEMICLMHSELSEAMEGDRKKQMDDHLPHRTMVEVELADTIIRILDFAGGFNLDIAGALVEKVIYNANRSDHKIENRQKEGGKSY